MSKNGIILDFDYDAEIPEKKRQGAKSAVNWVGTVQKFYDAFLKTGKNKTKVKLGDTVKAGTAYAKLREAIKDEKNKLKDKVEVFTSRHNEKKIAQRGKNKDKEIDATVIDDVFLRITEKESQKKSKQ